MGLFSGKYWSVKWKNEHSRGAKKFHSKAEAEEFARKTRGSGQPQEAEGFGNE